VRHGTAFESNSERHRRAPDYEDLPTHVSAGELVSERLQRI
jgi:hypothetical protein